jgi:hypothetical protein
MGQPSTLANQARVFGESDIVCIESITITDALIANAESTSGFTSITVKKLRLRRALKLKIRWRKKRGSDQSVVGQFDFPVTSLLGPPKVRHA